MRFAVLVVSFSCFATPALALELVSPARDGVVLGSRVPVEVRGTPAACRVDGALVAPAWQRLPWSDRWSTTVVVTPGAHVLEVGNATASFTSVARATAPAEELARHVFAGPGALAKWQWGPAVLAWGLERYALVSSDRARWVKTAHDFYASASVPAIDYPDVCAPALGALGLARDHQDPVGVAAASRVASYLATEKRNALGAIDHLGANGHLRPWASLFPPTRAWAHSIWVDSLVMYSIFATRWGAWRGDTALRDFGAAQPVIFADELQDPVTGLFTHAWDVPHQRLMGARWLRGNGWAALATVEVWEALPATHPRRAALARIFARLAAGLEARQQANGLWDSLVDVPGASYAETSGAALVAYALAKGARLGLLGASSRENAKRAFAALTARLARRSDGLALPGTSVATNPYPEWLYTIVPAKNDVDYGVGAYLLAAGELVGETW